MKRTIPLIAFIACSSLAMEIDQEKPQLREIQYESWKLYNEIRTFFDQKEIENMLISWHIDMEKKPSNIALDTPNALYLKTPQHYFTIRFTAQEEITQAEVDNIVHKLAKIIDSLASS